MTVLGLLLGSAIGGWIAYRLTRRFTRAEAGLLANPAAQRAHPELARLQEELAAAARHKNIWFVLWLVLLVAALVASGLSATDQLVRVALLASGVSLVAGIIFGVRWRTLQVRISRIAEAADAPASTGDHHGVAT